MHDWGSIKTCLKCKRCGRYDARVEKTEYKRAEGSSISKRNHKTMSPPSLGFSAVEKCCLTDQGDLPSLVRKVPGAVESQNWLIRVNSMRECSYDADARTFTEHLIQQ